MSTLILVDVPSRSNTISIDIIDLLLILIVSLAKYFHHMIMFGYSRSLTISRDHSLFKVFKACVLRIFLGIINKFILKI